MQHLGSPWFNSAHLPMGRGGACHTTGGVRRAGDLVPLSYRTTKTFHLHILALKLGGKNIRDLPAREHSRAFNTEKSKLVRSTHVPAAAGMVAESVKCML